MARDLGVAEHYLRLAVGTKRRAANERRRGRLGEHLAIDEASLKKGFIYATIFSDPGRGVVIDVGPGRGGAVVWAFAGLYSEQERAKVRVVTMDCHAPYRYIVRLALPNAAMVADAFHLHRQVNHALAEVRRAAWNRLRKAGGKTAGQVMKDARYGLARARDELMADTSDRGARQRSAVEAALGADDDLAHGYQLKEAFRAAMAIAKTGDVTLFTAALELFDALCRESGLKPFATLARSLRSWPQEILDYAATGGASNGFAEGLKHLVKSQKRQAHGYRSWLGFRGQILWCFREAVDPDTGELVALRSAPEAREPGSFNPRSRRAGFRRMMQPGAPFTRSSCVNAMDQTVVARNWLNYSSEAKIKDSRGVATT